MQSRNRILGRIPPSAACLAVALPAAMLLIPLRAAADERIDDRVAASRLDDRLADARIADLKLSMEAVEEEEVMPVLRLTAAPRPAPPRKGAVALRIQRTRCVAAADR